MASALEAIKPREATTDRWNVYVVADYGVGDPAFAEVAASLRAQHGGLSAEKIAVPPFSTIATGFWIRQLGIEDAYQGMVIFSNTAPRGTPEAIHWQGDERQRLLFAMLDTNIPVVAVSSGFNWSLVKDRIKQLDDGSFALYDLDIPNTGTQFRSRDIYPPTLMRLLKGDRSILGAQLDPMQIPEVPLHLIAYIDGYGNIKTTTRASQFPEILKNSPYLKIRIGNPSVVAYNHLSGKEAGLDDIGFTAGSSGGNDPFLEIYKRGGSAAYALGNPKLYDLSPPIEFSPLEIG